MSAPRYASVFTNRDGTRSVYVHDGAFRALFERIYGEAAGGHMRAATEAEVARYVAGEDHWRVG